MILIFYIIFIGSSSSPLWWHLIFTPDSGMLYTFYLECALYFRNWCWLGLPLNHNPQPRTRCTTNYKPLLCIFKTRYGDYRYLSGHHPTVVQATSAAVESPEAVCRTSHHLPFSQANHAVQEGLAQHAGKATTHIVLTPWTNISGGCFLWVWRYSSRQSSKTT